LVVDALYVLAAHAEADRGDDVVHDLAHTRSSLTARHVGQHGLVAACDVVPDARRGDRVLVREHAPDGDGVTLVVICHQGRRAHGRMLLARADLVHGALLDRVAADRHSVDQFHLFTSLKCVLAENKRAWRSQALCAWLIVAYSI